MRRIKIYEVDSMKKFLVQRLLYIAEGALIFAGVMLATSNANVVLGFVSGHVMAFIESGGFIFLTVVFGCRVVQEANNKENGSVVGLALATAGVSLGAIKSIAMFLAPQHLVAQLLYGFAAAIPVLFGISGGVNVGSAKNQTVKMFDTIAVLTIAGATAGAGMASVPMISPVGSWIAVVMWLGFAVISGRGLIRKSIMALRMHTEDSVVILQDEPASE